MEEITINGVKYSTNFVHKKDHIMQGEDSLNVNFPPLSISSYQIFQIYKKCIIFEVIYQDKVYRNCIMTEIGGNLQGYNRTTPFWCKIRY